MTRFIALVADDEALARAMVAGLLRRDPDIERVIECGDAEAVREALTRERVDLVFLDIEMPEVSGLELASSFGPVGPVVVFVTAFNRYAPNAFDVQAIDYVMKPFSDERFSEATERAKRRVRERQIGKLADQLLLLSSELKHGDAPADVRATIAPRRLALKQGDRSVVLDESEILWVEAEDYYVLVHAARGRHMIRASLAAMEQRLSASQFVRAHRGALVNIDAIAEMRDGDNVLVLTSGTIVPISRSRKPHVEAAFEARFDPKG